MNSLRSACLLLLASIVAGCAPGVTNMSQNGTTVFVTGQTWKLDSPFGTKTFTVPERSANINSVDPINYFFKNVNNNSLTSYAFDQGFGGVSKPYISIFYGEVSVDAPNHACIVANPKQYKIGETINGRLYTYRSYDQVRAAEAEYIATGIDNFGMTLTCTIQLLSN